MNFVHSVRPHDFRYPHNATQDIPSFPLRFENEKPNNKTKFGDAFALMWEVLKTASGPPLGTVEPRRPSLPTPALARPR